MKKLIMMMAMGFMIMGMSGDVFAHTPICLCYENDDGTVTCEGGFSNGASAAGVKIVIKDGKGKVLIEGKLDEDSEYTFKKPKVAYKVMFEAGEGHSMEVDSSEIAE
ncbi:MAG: hypothetical protein JW927_20035 [Deltaproteobacteria bacterium]|nr:hypothetical protein [Deltaproteobacteria bacterium]